MSSPRDGSSSDEDDPADGSSGTDDRASGRDDPVSGRDDPADGSRASSDLRSDGTPPDGGDGERSEPDPRRTASDGGGQPETGSGPLALVRRFRRSDHGAVVFVREMLSSAAIVLAIGLVLFAVSGVWPPMVAIESGSMDPHMQQGDLVFIMDEGRLVPAAAQGDTGIVTAAAGAEAGYTKFDGHGDVIVYKPDGKDYETPIIHRAMFWVDEGENWYDEANEQYVQADSCEELRSCPAPNSGFVTKGDANPYYDQSDAMGISSPVEPSWIRGTAEVRVPWLGCIRLEFSGAATCRPIFG